MITSTLQTWTVITTALWEKRLNSFIEMFDYGILQDAGKVSAEIMTGYQVETASGFFTVPGCSKILLGVAPFTKNLAPYFSVAIASQIAFLAIAMGE